MPIEDVFGIMGRGRWSPGGSSAAVKTGEEIEIVGFGATRRTVVTGVEMFQKTLDEGLAGRQRRVFTARHRPHEIERGQVLAKPGSILPKTAFGAEVYVLSKEEGAAHALFQRLSAAVLHPDDRRDRGRSSCREGVEMVMPGTTFGWRSS